MARIKKIQENGSTIYPVTIPQAIKDPTTNKTFTEILNQLSYVPLSGNSTINGGLTAKGFTVEGYGNNNVLISAGPPKPLSDFALQNTDVKFTKMTVSDIISNGNVTLTGPTRLNGQTYSKQGIQFENKPVDEDPKFWLDDGTRKSTEELNIAEKDGKYEKMTVGFSENIIGDAQASVDQKFVFRPTAGVNRNTKNDGAAQIISLKGNSVVWNQKVKLSEYLPSTITKNGVTITNNNGTISVSTTSNGATADTTFVLGIDQVAGSKMLIWGAPTSSSLQTFYLIDEWSGYTDLGKGVIFPKNTQTSNVAFVVKAGVVIATPIVFTPILINLTQMFGASNEPQSIEEFYNRIIADDMSAYDEGTIVNFAPKAIKTNGINQWDEQWEAGQISSATGNFVTGGNKIISKNFIPAIPNTSYFITLPLPQDDSHGVYYYDINKQFIKYQGMPSGLNKYQFTTPSNCAFIKFDSWGTTYNNDICISIVWPEYATFEGYTPYKPFERDLTWIKTIKDSTGNAIFHNGLCSAGEVKDEIRWNSAINKYEAIKRVGVVDLGSLTWIAFSDVGAGWFYTPVFASLGGVNILSEKYSVTTKLYGQMPDKTMNVIGSTSAFKFCIHDSTYTDAATFKAAMDGVMLNYELATSLVIPIEDNINLTYDVDDRGTEEILGVSGSKSTPIDADIVYQPNALATIKNVPLIAEDVENIKTGYAKKKGEYKELTAGFAYEILGDSQATSEEFSFRPTGGPNRNVRDGSARIEVLKGNSVVWNSLVENGHFDKGKDSSNNIPYGWKNGAWIMTSRADMTYPQEGGILFTTKEGVTGNGTLLVSNFKAGLINANDKYLLTFDYYSDFNWAIGDTTGGLYRISVEASAEKKHIETIKSFTVDIKEFGIQLLTFYSAGQRLWVDNIYLCNLTKMFGAGNEPATIEQFYEMMPIVANPSAYNEGEIVDANYKAIKTTGFNQYNGTYAKVLGGVKYYLGGTYTSIGYTTEKGGTTEAITLPTSTEIVGTTPSDRLYTPSQNGYIYAQGTDICINIAWDEYSALNGTYKPYKPFERDLSLANKYFPATINGETKYGMRRAGTAHDEIRFNSTTQQWEAVQKVGVVDLGSLSWSVRTTAQTNKYSWGAVLPTPSVGTDVIANITCQKYVTGSANDAYLLKDKTIAILSNALGVAVNIYDSMYVDATYLNSFVESLQGVMLNYELATPIVTPITEDVNLAYDVADYGTEQLIVPEGAQSAPLSAEVVYEPNVLASIKQVAAMLTRLDALETAVATMQASAIATTNEE